MKKINRLVFVLLTILSLTACTSDEDEMKSRPRGYLRIDLPKKDYKTYSADCPFSFESPVYAVVHPDEDPHAEPCWLNVDFPKFKGRIHLTYKKVDKNNLHQFLEDAYKLASKHQIKASAIGEMRIVRDSAKVYGLMYDIEGNAASSLQFYLTDSVHNYVRGALYFIAPPNSDSLAPVSDFIRADGYKMVNTFKWKD